MNTPAFKDKFLAFIFKNFQWLLALVILSGVFDSVVGVGGVGWDLDWHDDCAFCHGVVFKSLYKVKVANF